MASIDPENDPHLPEFDNTLLVKILRRLTNVSGGGGAPAGTFVLRAGDTMTGPLILSGDPTNPNGAATKNYVDATVAAAGPFVLRAGDLMTGTLGVNNAVAPPLVGIGLNLGPTGQNNVLRINGDSTANHAPVLDFFRSGNREFFLAPVGNSPFFGNSSGLADFLDATLSATPNVELTSTGAWKINRGSIAANDPSLNITTEWNNGATSFTGIQLTLTDTASLAASSFLDFTNVTSRFSVRKDGRTTVAADLLVAGAASPSLAAVKVNVGAVTAQNAVCVNGDTTANHAPVFHLLRSGGREVTLAIVGTSFYIMNTAALADYNDATLSASPTLEHTSTGAFKITRGSITSAAVAGLEMTEEWAAASVFTAIRLRVTDSLSLAPSLLIDLGVGVLSKFSVTKTGATSIAGALNMNSNVISGVSNPVGAQDAATKAYVDSPVDSTFRIVGSGDATKKLAFEVDGFTTATTRTITVPNVSSTMEVISNKDVASGYAGLTAGTKLNLAQMQEVMGLADLSDVTIVTSAKGNILAATGLTWNSLPVGSNGQVLTADTGAGVGVSWVTPATAFSDSAFRVQDNGDATKQLAFEVSGVTTGTTRTLTVPNVSSTIEVISNKDVASGYAGLTAGTKLNLSQMQEVMGLSDLTDVGTVTATKGKLLVADGSVYDDLTVGSNNQILIADSAQTLGVKWGTLELSARVYHSANQSIANNTNTALAFDTEEFDNGGFHDNATNNNRLTATVAGRYFVHAQVAFAASAVGQRTISIVKNAADFKSLAQEPANGTQQAFMETSTLVDLAVNDYVQVIVAQDSGGALNADALSNIDPVFTIFKVN